MAYKHLTDATLQVLAQRIFTKLKSWVESKGYKTTDTTYSVATASAHGLMSATDKQKLDSLGATIALSTSSWTVDVTTDGWNGTAAPYSKTIAVSGMKDTYEPIMSLLIPEGTSATNTSLAEKAYGCINRFTTAKDSITIYCHNKKPSIGFKIKLKGV